jgi:hypothetical protein
VCSGVNYSGVLHLDLRCVEAQVCHATYVKKHALTNTYKTKEYVLARDATRHDAGTVHV